MDWTAFFIVIGCGIVAIVLALYHAVRDERRPIPISHGDIRLEVQPGMCGCGNWMTDIRLDRSSGEVRSTCHYCASDRLVATLVRKDR